MNDLCPRCSKAYDHEVGDHVCQSNQRKDRNVPYAVPDGIANAAVDAAYMEFCRVLGRWNPEFPGQRDALKSALHHSWEISTNLIEAAVLRSLADQLTLRVMAHSAAVARNPEGSDRRKRAAVFLVASQSLIQMITEMVNDRDAFGLAKMGGAEDG